MRTRIMMVRKTAMSRVDTRDDVHLHKVIRGDIGLSRNEGESFMFKLVVSPPHNIVLTLVSIVTV